MIVICNCLPIINNISIDCIHAYLIPSNISTTTNSRRLSSSLIRTIFPSSDSTSKPSLKPSILPSFKSTIKPSLLPSKVPTYKPTLQPSLVPSYKPTMPTFAPTKPTSFPSKKPSSIPSYLPTKKPITYRPTASKGCTRVIDFSGSVTSGVVSSASNCNTFKFPATYNITEISVCGYKVASTSLPDLLWQVKYFNTLYSGGIGLDSCPYHDICAGYMIQLTVSDVFNLNDARFSMVSTPTSSNSIGTYSIYGSNTAGVRGTDLLYSDQTLNEWLTLPTLQGYKYLSFVANSQTALGPSGILLQKLRVTAPCLPTQAPSPVPTTLKPSLIPTNEPSRPTRKPTFRPSRKPTTSSPSRVPSMVPSSPTLHPTTVELKNFFETSANTYSSRPVLMHQFQFIGSQPMFLSASCNQYVVDRIQNSTASICNNVEISSGKAIFKSTDPPLPYIEINNIVELADVNVFSIATWVTLGKTTYDGSFPLFSFGDLSFPFAPSLPVTSESSPYESLGCHSKEIAKIASTVVKSLSHFNNSIADCRTYAQSNHFDYFIYGPSFCRYISYDNS